MAPASQHYLPETTFLGAERPSPTTKSAAGRGSDVHRNELASNWCSSSMQAIRHSVQRSAVILLHHQLVDIGWQPFRNRLCDCECTSLFQCTLPNNHGSHALAMQLSAHESISVQRVLKLLLPEVFARLRRGREFAARVAMPKTAIDENRCVEPSQPKVGATNDFRAMQGVSVS